MNKVERNLYERGFNEHLLNFFNPAIDEDDGVATFYLWNLSGQLKGYQHYRPNATKEKRNEPKSGRYYTQRPSAKEAVAIGGLETYDWTAPLFVVEGLFDAVRLWNLGWSCIWTCGLPDPQVQHWIRNQPKPAIAILDPGVDDAMKKCFTSCCALTIKPEDYNVFTDLGSSTDDEVVLLVGYSIQRLANIVKENKQVRINKG